MGGLFRYCPYCIKSFSLVSRTVTRPEGDHSTSSQGYAVEVSLLSGYITSKVLREPFGDRTVRRRCPARHIKCWNGRINTWDHWPAICIIPKAISSSRLCDGVTTQLSLCISNLFNGDVYVLDLLDTVHWDTLRGIVKVFFEFINHLLSRLSHIEMQLHQDQAGYVILHKPQHQHVLR